VYGRSRPLLQVFLVYSIQNPFGAIDAPRLESGPKSAPFGQSLSSPAITRKQLIAALFLR
jgi:hypothetical protein